MTTLIGGHMTENGAKNDAATADAGAEVIYTSLAAGIRASSGRCDDAVKRLLSERQVVARILAATLVEFEGADVDDIASACIDGDPEVGTYVARDVPLAQASVTDPGQADVLNLEDSTPSEGTSIFDIRLRVRIPSASESIDDSAHASDAMDDDDHSENSEPLELMEVDIEGQGSYPTSKLVRRGVYYAGRMLSQQGAGVVAHSHYERLRKVASIWVCTRPPKRQRATVARLDLSPVEVLGNPKLESRFYDRISVVLIFLGPGSREAGGIVGMLDTLLAADLGVEEKLALLHDQYGMMITTNLEEGARDMITEEDVYMWGFERGEVKGEESGYKKGEESGYGKGRFDTLAANVRSLVANLHVTLEAALDACGLTGAERAKVAAAVEQR